MTNDGVLAGRAAADAPRVKPRTYPGVWPTTSILLAGDHEFELSLKPGRRLGQAMVTMGDVPPPGMDAFEDDWDHWPLDFVLQQFNRALSDGRYPVLAVGSNASTAQLRHKFGADRVPILLPLVKARVDGLMVGVASRIAPYGSVPSTAVKAEGATCDLFVQWLDRQQLDVVDESEGTGDEDGYRRGLLRPEDGVRITLPSGEVLGGCYAYFTPSHLVNADGSPLPFDFEQSSLISSLLGRSEKLRDEFGDSVDSWFDRVAQGSPGRFRGVLDGLTPETSRTTSAVERAGAIFRDEGWVGTATAGEHADINSAPRYGELPPARRLVEGEQPCALVCGSSSDGLDRHGQSVVRLPSDRWESLGHPRFVAIRRLPLSDEPLIADLEAVALVANAVSPNERLASVPDETIEVDEVLRVAIGVEIGEVIATRPVQASSGVGVVNQILGTPTHLTCRVQKADLLTAEREVCLLSPLTLEIVGVESGDDVIVEGRDPAGSNVVGTMKMKAFAITDDIRESRMKLHGGDLNSRFPRVRESLGKHHELPWIFLDRATRTALNLGSQELPVVRVRPSRSQQFLKEIREIALVLAIALVALVEVVPRTSEKVGVVIVTVIAALVIITLRMRRRLSYSRRRMVDVDPDQAVGELR